MNRLVLNLNFNAMDSNHRFFAGIQKSTSSFQKRFSKRLEFPSTIPYFHIFYQIGMCNQNQKTLNSPGCSNPKPRFFKPEKTHQIYPVLQIWTPKNPPFFWKSGKSSKNHPPPWLWLQSMRLFRVATSSINPSKNSSDPRIYPMNTHHRS